MSVDENVRHPDTDLGPVYPMCDVLETRAGHGLIFDNTSREVAKMLGDKDLEKKVTKDNRVVRMSHALGSYWEINERGNWKSLTQKNRYSYVKGGRTTTTEKGEDTRASHTRNLIGSDNHREIAGDQYDAHTGDRTLGGKNFTVGIKGDLTLASSGGDVVITNPNNGGTWSSKELVIKTNGGDLVMTVKGEMYQHVRGNMSTMVDGDYKIKARRLILEGVAGIATIGPSISGAGGFNA